MLDDWHNILSIVVVAFTLLLLLIVVMVVVTTPLVHATTTTASYEHGFALGKTQGLMADWADGIADSCDGPGYKQCSKGFIDGWNQYCHEGRYHCHEDQVS